MHVSIRREVLPLYFKHVSYLKVVTSNLIGRSVGVWVVLLRKLCNLRIKASKGGGGLHVLKVRLAPIKGYRLQNE